MTDTTTVHGDRLRFLHIAPLLALLLIALALVLFAAWLQPTELSAAIFTGSTVVATAAVLVLTRSRFDAPVLLSVAGLALVAVGSGIGRPRDEVTVPVGPDVRSGDVIGRLDIWEPLVGLGLVLGVAALIWSLATHQDRSGRVSATGSLLVLGLGYVVVAVLMKELVVAQWISGRPIRRGRRIPTPTATRRRSSNAGDLWLDAAADEAAAVIAFSELAKRLHRVGAPGVLIERCVEAAREEERHAQVCERLAASLGTPRQLNNAPFGSDQMPVLGDLRQRSFARPAEVVRLAVESFVDGVVGEGFAARRLEAGSETVAVRHRGAIRRMASEERRHAVLGAHIVEWALMAHPLLVGAALRAAGRRIAERVEPPLTLRRCPTSDLRRVGLVDAEHAQGLWSRQRTTALRWLDQTLEDTTSPAERVA